MRIKGAGGMANCVAPDQTAISGVVWSWSALFPQAYLSKYAEFHSTLKAQISQFNLYFSIL